MKSPDSVWKPAIGLLAVAYTIAAISGGRGYAGSAGVYVFFNFAFFILLALIFPRPRLYAYTFFALLLSLGFWLKTMAQSIWTVGFIEPTGGFDATALSWDNGLTVAAWGALGAAFSRLIHILTARKRASAESIRAHPAPYWFTRSRRTIWAATIILIAGVNLANFHYAIFQVGMNPRLILPVHLNVVVAWLVNIGFALWLATLVYWEFQNDERSLLRSLQLPVFEGLVSSVSALSRLLVLLHMIPYVFAIAENWSRFRAILRSRALIRRAAAVAVAIVLCLSFVFLLRIMQYDELARLAMKDSLGTFYRQLMIDDVPKLFLHRWVGLEGVLSANAAADRGQDSLLAILKEDPRRGSGSIFQRVAKTPYLSKDPGTNTFLSNAGITAILAFSGSLAVVFLGMALTMVISILTEVYAQALTGNPFFVALAGAGVANVVTQTTFPYLTAVYLFQLWVAVAFIYAIQRIGSPAVSSSSA